MGIGIDDDDPRAHWVSRSPVVSQPVDYPPPISRAAIYNGFGLCISLERMIISFCNVDRPSDRVPHSSRINPNHFIHAGTDLEAAIARSNGGIARMMAFFYKQKGWG